MSFNDIIDSVIASINEDISTLNDLLKDTQDVTLIAGDLDTIPPIFNDGTSTWTLNQDVANGSGIYEGVYQLPTGSNCTMLQIVNVAAYQAPLTCAPARLKPCESMINPTPTFADQPTLQAIDWECGSAFIIRSAIPFEVEIALSDCIPVLFEWESGASNTLEGCTAKPRVILRIDGGGVLPNDVEVDITIVGGTATGGGTDYNLLTTSVLFPSGSPDGTTKTVDVQIISDGLTESNETIILGIEPDEGDLGDVTTLTLTILPGGCSKTWTQNFTLNLANGAQGWTITNGEFVNGGWTGFRTTGAAFPFYATCNLTFAVPHSSVLTAARFIVTWDWTGGGRHCRISVNGSHWSAPGNQVLPVGGSYLGYSGSALPASNKAVTVECHLQAGQQYGFIGNIQFQGTGINPFMGT